MLISLISAKGSPGVTTTAAALAAVGGEPAAGRSLLAELDPAGGDVEPLTGLTGEPLLLQAATDLARGLRPRELSGYAVSAPPGVSSLLAPTAGLAAAAMIRSALDRWGPTLSAYDGIVVADCGRWESDQSTASRIAGSDVVALVCRPTQASVEHVRHIVDPVRQLARPVAVITVGDRPYSLAEVAAALDVYPAGTIAWDPRGAGSLWVDGMGERRRRRSGWSSTWHARSAREVLGQLLDAAPDALPQTMLTPPETPAAHPDGTPGPPNPAALPPAPPSVPASGAGVRPGAPALPAGANSPPPGLRLPAAPFGQPPPPPPPPPPPQRFEAPADTHPPSRPAQPPPPPPPPPRRREAPRPPPPAPPPTQMHAQARQHVSQGRQVSQVRPPRGEDDTTAEIRVDEVPAPGGRQP